MRYALLVACLVVSSCAVRMNGQTQTRSLEIRPRTTAIDLSLFQITDDQGLNPRITAGFGTASFGEIQIHTGPTASPRTAFLSATSLAATTLIADSQNGARGQIQIDSDTGSPLVILPAAGMAGAIAWQLPGTNVSGVLTNDGAGNLSWTPGGGAFVCSTANNCVNLTDSQSIGGTKTFTADVNMQSNALIFNTLTLGDTLSRGRVLVQGTNFVDEIVLEANRDGFGDSLRIVNNSGVTKAFLGTVNSGNDGSFTLGGAMAVSLRGGSSGAGGAAGIYFDNIQRVTPTVFKSSDGTSGITNPACNSPFNLKDGIVVGCS